MWNDIECLLKRIEFSEDLEFIEREIRIRESLIKAMFPTWSKEHRTVRILHDDLSLRIAKRPIEQSGLLTC